MKRLPAILIGFVLVLVSVASPVFVSAEGATVPFKVRCVTYPEIVGGGLGFVLADIPADCIGTHLGNSGWHSLVTAYMDPTDPFNNPAPQYGDMTFTAADGSQLLGSFEGENVLIPGGGFNFWGSYEIVEGTGRFEGASGSGDYFGGGGNPASLTFEGELINP